MISLLPLGRIIAIVAVLYAAIACGILWLFYNPSISIWGAIGIAFGGSALLNVFIFTIFNYFWIRLWRKFPALNTLLFPNLNGTWDMTIYWYSDSDEGTSDAHALITQNFLKIAMDVEAKNSDSYTLVAKPKKDPESGRPILYYVYQTTPKATSASGDHAPYRGAAILQISLESTNKLSGNYFTSRRTNGHFELNRIGV